MQTRRALEHPIKWHSAVQKGCDSPQWRGAEAGLNIYSIECTEDQF
jgi:hypothetical protein